MKRRGSQQYGSTWASDCVETVDFLAHVFLKDHVQSPLLVLPTRLWPICTMELVEVKGNSLIYVGRREQAPCSGPLLLTALCECSNIHLSRTV